MLVLLVAAPAREVQGQDRYRAVQEENFRLEPGPRATLLARVSEGTEVVVQGRQDRWYEVVLEGWIWEPSVRATTRAGFDLSVTRAGGENLRAGPNGPVIARLLSGFLLEELGRRDGWVLVRRAGWMWAQSLAPVQPPVVSVDPDPSPDPGPAGPVARLDRRLTAGPTALSTTVEGDTVGTLVGGTPVRVVTREGDWARVQIEGWVRVDDLAPGSDEVLAGVTGTEVRSRPEDFEGSLLQWTVQYISLQTADELRQDLPPGRPYMLARGPAPERGFVYVVLSDEDARAIGDLEPLTTLTIIGRVRAARSQYLGNPILELVDYALAQP